MVYGTVLLSGIAIVAIGFGTFCYFMFFGSFTRSLTSSAATRILANSKTVKMSSSSSSTKKFSAEELKEMNGKDGRPLALCIRGRVFDVSAGSSFYGEGKSYNKFIGKDCSRAFAKTSLEDQDLNNSLEGLTRDELETLGQWEEKLAAKYPQIGVLEQ